MKITKISPAAPVLPKRKRVAAYARVSSGKDAMLYSLSAQVSYYSAYIQKHAGWEYAGVYADEAVSGTRDGRAEFQRLLAECRAGNIDMVITKSISRFARNTVTMLETVRELKSIGVDVYFEKENIHSMSGDGELMLTILASFAQEESRSVSENCKWRIRKQFQDGELVNLRFMFGYHVKKGVVSVDSARAEIVRMMFADYLGGMSTLDIANKLRNMGVSTVRGGEWTFRRVAAMLKNEKYTGNALLQKKYVADHLSKSLISNKGKLPMYYAEGTHPAIVDLATFEAVQLLITDKRANSACRSEVRHFPFTSKIFCGKCGKNYKRKVTKTEVAWNCSTFLERGKAYCHTKQIPESVLTALTAEIVIDIKEIVVPGFNKLVFNLADGSNIVRTWQDKSRRDSWDDAARQKARERQLEILERRCALCKQQEQ